MTLKDYRRIRLHLRMTVKVPPNYLLHRKQNSQNKTYHEKIVARALQSLGIRFNSQFDFVPYIVDFILYEKGIVLEVDGKQHLERVAYDERRTQYLENLGVRVVRVRNCDVATFAQAKETLGRLFNEKPANQS